MKLDWQTISAIAVTLATALGFYYTYYQKPIWDKIERLFSAVSDIVTSIQVLKESLENHKAESMIYRQESRRSQENFQNESKANQEKLQIQLTTLVEEQHAMDREFGTLSRNVKERLKTNSNDIS